LKKVFIPKDFFHFNKEQELSALVRPFFYEGEFQVASEQLERWHLSKHWILTSDWLSADLILFPGPANHYFEKGHKSWISKICNAANQKGIKSYLLITGDFGERFDDIPGLIFFRLGGFASKLSANNQGFPFLLSDHMQRLFETDDIAAIQWEDKPIVGFCGHASGSFVKAGKEKLKFLIENIRRFIFQPFRCDYEPLFASALERRKLLQKLEITPEIQSNFIYRKNYRAGAQTQHQRKESTYEYYQNIRNSAYVICVRGGGNFSVRLYETLMMGRIPVFVNTDCLLPFPEIIFWKEHMVWVEWKERHLIKEKILSFHHSLTPEKFIQLQLGNRQLWKKYLTLGCILEYLSDYTYL
jgi:hypothetical protein